MHPYTWYTHHLPLHGLRKVLNLRHGNSMWKPNEFHVNALECTLRIHTHDRVPSSPPSMTRECIWPYRTHIFMYMTKYHYMSSHQKHVFLIPYIKKHKKIIIKKNSLSQDSLLIYPYVDPGAMGMSGTP